MSPAAEVPLAQHFLSGLVVIASMAATSAWAVPLPISVPSERDDTTGFVGLNIPLTPTPHVRVVLGVRKTTVGSGGDVAGGEVRLSFDPWTLGGVQVRALALRGTVDHAGLMGGGWDFASGKPFGTLGVALPHLTGTADIGLDGFVPQFALGLDSLVKVTPPDEALIFPVPPIGPCSVPGGPGISVLGC